MRGIINVCSRGVVAVKKRTDLLCCDFALVTPDYMKPTLKDSVCCFSLWKSVIANFQALRQPVAPRMGRRRRSSGEKRIVPISAAANVIITLANVTCMQILSVDKKTYAKTAKRMYLLCVLNALSCKQVHSLVLVYSYFLCVVADCRSHVFILA